MSNLLKRALFAVYVLFVKVNKRDEEDLVNRQPETFIWKDAWFFLWHKFFWSVGRRTIAPLITTVKPLVYEEWSGEEHSDYQRFSELAARDNREREFHDKLLHSTRYKLAHDTGEALCRFYEHTMIAAPWQYGVEARRRAKTLLRNIFLVSFAVFILLCNIDSPPLFYLAWVRLISFFAMLGSLSGWYASVRIYHIALETTRMRAKRNAPQL